MISINVLEDVVEEANASFFTRVHLLPVLLRTDLVHKHLLQLRGLHLENAIPSGPRDNVVLVLTADTIMYVKANKERTILVGAQLVAMSLDLAMSLLYPVQTRHRVTLPLLKYIIISSPSWPMAFDSTVPMKYMPSSRFWAMLSRKTIG